jgi:hypothetical protein
MNRLRHFLSICTHCIVAVLFLVGSYGLRAEQLCDVENPCADSEVTSCCTSAEVEQTASNADCCTTSHSEDDEKEHKKSHHKDHICQCCTITKNLIAPIKYSDNEIGIKINLNPGDLNSYFTLLLISKPFHPPNNMSIS